MTTAIKNAEKLRKDIQKKLDNWNERSQFTLKGVKNLSRSDLDSLDMYADFFIKNGGYGFAPFRKPLGEIKEVLDKYQIIDKTIF